MAITITKLTRPTLAWVDSPDCADWHRVVKSSKSWSKIVTSCDPSLKGGYSIVGQWIDHSVEVRVEVGSVITTCADIRGGRFMRILRVEADGTTTVMAHHGRNYWDLDKELPTYQDALIAILTPPAPVIVEPSEELVESVETVESTPTEASVEAPVEALGELVTIVVSAEATHKEEARTITVTMREGDDHITVDGIAWSMTTVSAGVTRVPTITVRTDGWLLRYLRAYMTITRPRDARLSYDRPMVTITVDGRQAYRGDMSLPMSTTPMYISEDNLDGTWTTREVDLHDPYGVR